MQSLHHILMYVVYDIDYMLRYLLSIYLSSISITDYRVTPTRNHTQTTADTWQHLLCIRQLGTKQG